MKLLRRCLSTRRATRVVRWLLRSLLRFLVVLLISITVIGLTSLVSKFNSQRRNDIHQFYLDNILHGRHFLQNDVQTYEDKFLPPDKNLIKFWSTSNPYRAVESVDCRLLLEGDETAVRDAKYYVKSHPRKHVPDELFIKLTSNCTDYIHRRRYFTHPQSQTEAEYPIAYSILFYNNLQQTEKLLRAIYHPQNLYCIHLDRKVSSVLYMAAQSLTRCFDNVILTEHREHIVYAGYSRLQADINCMNEVIATNHTWKYYINLSSMAFPLRTNAEIVNILKVYNGSNDIEGISNRVATNRFKRKWFENRNEKGGKMIKLNETNPPPPHGITIVRGSAYGTFSRDFVRFILEDERARDLLNWSRTTYSPDEHYWATLNHLKDNSFLHTPGGYAGVPEDKPWLSSYSAWGRRTVDPCFSKHGRHGVCIFGIDDLPMLMYRKEFFANKFEDNFQYLALECIEEYLYNRTITNQPFDTFYYRTLPFINRPSIWPPPKKKT